MKKMSKTMTAAAIIGTGVVGWMMYKKKNPNATNDMKNMAKNAASSMLEKLENME